jgi:hypothetical protein
MLYLLCQAAKRRPWSIAQNDRLGFGVWTDLPSVISDKVSHGKMETRDKKWSDFYF